MKAEDITSMSLDNGIHIVLLPVPWMSTIIARSSHDVGSTCDPVSAPGMAHIGEHVLLEHPGSASRALDARGGEYNGDVRYTYTTYEHLFPSCALEQGIDAMLSPLHGVRLVPSELARHVAIIEQEIRCIVNGLPYGGFPWRDIGRALFGRGHPYARDPYGAADILRRLKTKEVVNFVESHYCASGMSLALVGDFDASRAIDILGTRPMPLREPSACTEPDRGGTDISDTVVYGNSANHGAVAFGWVVSDSAMPIERYAAFLVLESILSVKLPALLKESYGHSGAPTARAHLGIRGPQLGEVGPTIFILELDPAMSIAPDRRWPFLEGGLASTGSTLRDTELSAAQSVVQLGLASAAASPRKLADLMTQCRRSYSDASAAFELRDRVRAVSIGDIRKEIDRIAVARPASVTMLPRASG